MRNERDSRETVMVAEQIVFCNCQFKIENVKKLAFDATNVAFTEDSSTECPVHILQCRFIEILVRKED